MNDHELDRLVASAAPVRDGWLGGLDLWDAEAELTEEIMATTDTAVPPASGPPTNEPSPFARAPRRSRLAAAMGLVAASLAVVVLVRSMAGNGNDVDEVKAGSAPAITPMLADPVPDGYEVDFADPEKGPDPRPSPVGPINTWVYGDLTATALTNDVVIKTEPTAPELTVATEPVTVRGRRGGLCSPGSYQCDFGNSRTGVSWTEDSGVYVALQSRSFDREHMLAIAEGVIVDGNTARLGNVPAGVTKPPKVAELNDDWRWAYKVQYSSPDGGSFSVATRSETEAQHTYALWLYGPRGAVTVQGHDVAFDDVGAGAYELMWEPVPGELVGVMTNGVDETTARDLAETVRPATSAKWAHIQELAANAPDVPTDIEPPPDDAVHRALADGSTEVWGWWSDDGGLCYKVYKVEAHGDSSEQ